MEGVPFPAMGGGVTAVVNGSDTSVMGSARKDSATAPPGEYTATENVARGPWGIQTRFSATFQLVSFCFHFSLADVMCLILHANAVSSGAESARTRCCATDRKPPKCPHCGVRGLPVWNSTPVTKNGIDISALARDNIHCR